MSQKSPNAAGPIHGMKCRHGEAAFRVSRTADNPNREFYACPLDRSDPLNCRFFSEILLDSLLEPLPLRSAEWADEVSGPGKPPSKHPQVPLTPSSPSKRPRYSPSDKLMGATSIPKNEVSDDELELLKFPVPDLDENDLNIEAFDSLPPPKRFRFNSPTPSRVAAPQTPSGPQTNQAHRFGSPFTTPNKSQWQKIQEDSENPFHKRGANLFSSPSVVTSPSTPTADSVAAALELLQSVPAAMRKWERKLVATEKSRDARDQRVAELEKEVTQLKEQNIELQHTIKTLQTMMTN